MRGKVSVGSSGRLLMDVCRWILCFICGGFRGKTALTRDQMFVFSFQKISHSFLKSRVRRVNFPHCLASSQNCFLKWNCRSVMACGYGTADPANTRARKPEDECEGLESYPPLLPAEVSLPEPKLDLHRLNTGDERPSIPTNKELLKTAPLLISRGFRQRFKS